MTLSPARISIFLLCLNLLCCGKNPAQEVATNENVTEIQRTQAVQSVLNTRSECSGLGDFYWELGNKNGVLASGTSGSGNYTANTVNPLASASKWLFGAYVIEKRNGSLNANDRLALQMGTGYISFSFCLGTQTVGTCHTYSDNDTNTPASVGKFNYGGGHFQAWGASNGISSLNKTTLTTEYQTTLGSDIGLTFTSPQLAGGMSGSAAQYAVFLRKILKSQLQLSSLLGTSPVCTLPASCATAEYSPAPEAWHYSIGHWVEDDPTSGDGAYSSPGAFGFYPWIDSSKEYYGILARYDTTNASNPPSTSSYWRSVQCGRLLRKAWLNGSSSF